MKRTLWALAGILLLAGCGTHEFALVAAEQNAQLTTARNEEFRSFVMASDARQRASLDRELDLIAQMGEAAIEAKFAADLAAASSPGADSRPVVAVTDVAALVAAQNADRAATRAAIAAKRREIAGQLDAELRAWLDDPKARQQDRIAAALAVYARQNSEFSRFMSDTGAKLGVSLPGGAK